MESTALPTELTVLAWSVVLLLVHIVAQTLSLVKDGGLTYAMSNRDGEVANLACHRSLDARLAQFRRDLWRFHRAGSGPGRN